MIRPVAAILFIVLAAPLPSAAAAAGTKPSLSFAQTAPAIATDWSAQRRSTRRARGPIACTRSGCHPVPPGCYPVPGRDWRNLPSGFDVIVCPRRRR